MKLLVAALAAASFLLLACGRDIHNKEAIRQGVIDHLSSRKGLDLDLSAMTLDITAVTFRENEAEAVVNFQPKGGGSGMSMKYTLERQGNRWAVKSKAESGASHSGGVEAAPPGELPPGHPPVQKQ